MDRSVCLATLVVLLAGCQEGGEGSAFTVPDSAGVAIAVNATPLDELPRWELDATPLRSIGVLDGEAAYQFGYVLAGARLSDGRIAVLDVMAQEVRYFGADGQHLLTIGRKGSGPGEFRGADRIVRLGGDSLLVWDERLRRFTILHPDGTVATTVPAPGGMNPSLVTITADGGYLLADDILRIPDVGFADRTLRVTRHGADGTAIGEAVNYPAAPIGKLGDLDMVGGPLFAPNTAIAATPGGYFVATAREYEVSRHDASGTVTGIIRWNGPDRTIRAEDVARHRAGELESESEDTRAYYTKLHAVQPVAERFPAYAWAMTDRAGALRIMEIPRPGTPGPVTWLAFDAEGRLLGRLAVPAKFRMLEWGDDYLLGVLPDESDVEQVVLYQMVRGR